jgi:GTP-binding protein
MYNPAILQCQLWATAMTEQNNSSSAPPAVPRSPRPTSDADLAVTGTADEKAAMAWAHTARFLTTASELHQLSPNELPEIAFVGRSNAGKSTAINTITQQKRLAFASKTPGRTQHINLFELGPKAAPDTYFADLPGYGYAAVARGAKLRWQKVMADYLEIRRSLTGVVLMVDSRLGFTDLDKLNRKDSDAALLAAQKELEPMSTDESDVAVALFSALHKKGVGDAAMTLHSWSHPPASK